ncbi:MAG: CrcB family protein [Thermoleophilia bacterium]|nr:CrcB family protein [Thermoleophilia bacterium]
MRFAGTPPTRAAQVAATFAGGAAGAVVRVLLGRHVPVGSWPWPTLVANLVGALLLGFVAGRYERDHPLSPGRALWGGGFCGALTTFSTLQWELVRMAESGRTTGALAYLAASLALGLGAVHVGVRAERELRA